jgi:hypothetical protein
MEALVNALDIRASNVMTAAVIPDARPGRDAANADDRRRGGRIRTVFRIAKVARDRAVGLWRVRNISDFGMMLLTRSRVARGERLTITLSSNLTIDGRVVWSSGDACGVAFDAPIDSAALLSALATEKQERDFRPPRVEASIRACIYGEDGVQPVTVSDVSQQGVGFSHASSFQAGVRVRVLFENGLERRGIVRWAGDQRAGVQLFDPLSCDELETLLALETAPAKAAVED